MNSPIRRLAVALAATALSATLLHLGTGLTPVPWLTWLAPLPVLVLAHHAGARTAFLAASAAWLGGETAMWGYLLDSVRIPPPMVASMLVGSALLFGLVVLSSRALMLRGRPLAAAAVVPAAWVTVEYAVSVLSPNGAWWSMAYTQADVLPVLQTVSVTGPWGVTFLVLGVPAAVAAFFAPRAGGRLRVAVAAVITLTLAVGYGAWRLRPPYGEGPGGKGPGSEKVALLAADRNGSVPVASAEGRALLGRYAARIPGLAARGARVVVMPEKVFVADDATLPLLAAPLARLAADHHVDIIAGLILKRPGGLRNAAVDFPADGSRPVEYFKHHLIPGLESDFQPGDQKAFVPGSGRRWGIMICFDLDLPGLVRDYRRSGATAIFVPAWDFDRDRWLHGRMAVTRGVETGLTVARAARDGDLVVSDANGRIRTEAHSADTPFVSVLAALPSGSADTLYTRFGDWFAWACALLLLLALVSLTRLRAAAR
ncbi:nitrilase-related carbon-nitrogen hydrolase [Microbispora sp. NBC_01389]|uniref:nitrilase-related carbon-nitrogen hydrolase n=1 Tax=Microbispora sp. NBC_01389 TaxID=2903584 RepID=UPI0032437CE2